MRTLFNRWFLAFCCLFLFFYLSKFWQLPLPQIISFYYLDLLAVPIIANLGLFYQRKFVYKNPQVILNRWQVFFIVIYISLLFEAILPLFMKRYTRDLADVACYITGGLFFWIVMNKAEKVS